MNQYVAMPLPKAKQMKRFGFTNNVECEWYYTRQVGEHVTFNLSIDRESGAYETLVFDEFFGQPEYYGDMLPVYCNQIVANIDVILHELRLQGIAIEFDHAEYRTRPHRTRPHRIRPGTGQSISVGQVFSLERWEPGGGFVHAPA